jgi:hypothetical protein
MNTIRLPIRFSTVSSQMETIDETTDEYYATLIGFAIQIENNSLPISTFYGASDPAFDDRQTGRIVQEVSRHIPEIKVIEANTVKDNTGKTNLAIRFERLS